MLNQKTVNQLLMEVVALEWRQLAHEIYLAVQKGLVKLSDREATFWEIKPQLPSDEVAAITERNELGVVETRLYAIPLRDRAEFAYYLAHDQESVMRLHLLNFKESAANLYDVTHKINTYISYEHEKIGKAKSFFEISKQVTEYPFFICCMDAAKKKQ